MNPQVILLLAKLATDTLPDAIKLIQKWQSNKVITEMDALNAISSAKAEYGEAYDDLQERLDEIGPTEGSIPSTQPDLPPTEELE